MKNTWEMFDVIAQTYDKVNHILSLNIDVKWRKKVVEYAPKYPFELVDLATGTADLLLTLLQECPQITKATGVDLSQGMLKIGEQKVLDAGFYSKTNMRIGDATNLLLEDNSCDMTTISFGIRNTPNPLETLKEMKRIVRANGLVVVLEFSIPKNFLVRNVFLFYFRYLLPLIGGFFSKNYGAYRYLNQSVEKFPHGKSFADLMTTAELMNLKIIPLTFGIATLYIGRKPSD